MELTKERKIGSVGTHDRKIRNSYKPGVTESIQVFFNAKNFQL